MSVRDLERECRHIAPFDNTRALTFDRDRLSFKMVGSCVFNDLWLHRYKDWIGRGSDRYTARCTVCAKNFSVANMGESALSSHAEGSKHKQRIAQTIKSTHMNISEFFSKDKSGKRSEATSTPESDSVPASATTVTPTPSTSSARPTPGFVTTSDTQRSEVMWALKVATSHYSFNSSSDVGDLFHCMFPDSDIAAKFTCGERKCAYLCCFGLAPHFSSLLKEQVKKDDFDPVSDRVDKLFYETMSSCATYSKLWVVVKVLLLLSHGQATVERGFSINKEMEIENLKEESYVSLRIICDHVNSVGGVTKIPVTKALLMSAGSARQRYHAYLDDRKRQAEQEGKLKKEKISH